MRGEVYCTPQPLYGLPQEWDEDERRGVLYTSAPVRLATGMDEKMRDIGVRYTSAPVRLATGVQEC